MKKTHATFFPAAAKNVARTPSDTCCTKMPFRAKGCASATTAQQLMNALLVTFPRGVLVYTAMHVRTYTYYCNVPQYYFVLLIQYVVLVLFFVYFHPRMLFFLQSTPHVFNPMRSGNSRLRFEDVLNLKNSLLVSESICAQQ